MATLLHISDIHRTPDEKVGNSEVLRWLIADLEAHVAEGIPRPDLIVVSGDITQSAEQTYPTARDASFTIHSFEDLGLTLVGLSSLEFIDRDRHAASFNSDAVHAAIEAAESAGQMAIAIWHHDLDWERGQPDALSIDSLRLLSTGHFSLGLCGHTHRPANNDVCQISGYPLPVIAAGSLCAGPRQRPESRGRAYNILQIKDNTAKVWVRTKDERSKKWRDLSEFGPPTARRSWYEVSLTDEQPTARTNMGGAPRRAGVLRSPNPFSNANAKQAQRTRVINDYIWTRVADDAQIELPQIIVGTRGSGKTALLFTLTIESQLGRLPEPNSPLDVVGLFCQMRVNEVTAFNGKGSIDLGTRKELFRAAIASMWAAEMVDSIAYYNRWCDSSTASPLPEEEVVGALQAVWGVEPSKQTFKALRQATRSLRNRILRCLSAACTTGFDTMVADLRSVSLLGAGLTALSDAAKELRSWHPFEATRWTVLFDEVEFLSEWQQECIYEHVGSPSSSTSCKVATLPYAHSRALNEFPAVLVLGDDYGELSVVLGEDTDFGRVAKGLWKARLGDRATLSLEEVWPEEEYLLVVKRHLASVNSVQDLDELLIVDLPASSRERARRLFAENDRSFSDQYRRKFREPFRFRLSSRNTRDGLAIPLYWGWRQMLKACEANPRQFLLLAEICWATYWADGVRPLSAEEQYLALRQWAGAFTTRCAGLPHKGHELQELVQRIARKLTERLYNSPSLRNEHLSVQIEDCAQEQAEAIAIGIAYGFLVPKLHEDGTGRPMFPPSDIEMRLGYPVAVANRLPLRQGEVLKIRTMRQLELSWWNE